MLTRASDSSGVAALTKPIEQIRLGDRVAGVNPIRDQADLLEPDVQTWRRIAIHVVRHDGQVLNAEFLRPAAVIADSGLFVGAQFDVAFGHMEAAGTAEVTAIGPCPPIQPRPGTVVIGRFVQPTYDPAAHPNADRLVSVALAGQTEPTQVTQSHPYWSLDRAEFIAAGELRLGERVDTLSGETTVESVVPLDYTGLVYNLETTEHVYRVDALGTLVHNDNACATGPRILQSEVSVMTPKHVKRALRSGGYTGNTSWAYSIHDHHFYPRWLGGQDAGPLLRVRGFEHITDLEPALFEHMKKNIPGLTEKSSEQVKALIRSGRVTQDDITAALFDFYKARYPNVSDDTLLDILRRGL